MAYIGDFRLGDTFDTKFCTVSTTGAPTTLAASPVISAYVGNSTTEITAGITLTVDFDARTGLHNIRVVATSGNGFATASNYQLVITTGTVGGTSVVGYVVAEFSVENRSAIMPTTAARTLDVSAGGEAGLDWANVGSPTTTVDLSGTTIKTTQKVDVDTIKTNPVVNGGTITFPTTATLASTTNITAGTITTATTATNVTAISAGGIAAASFAAGAIDAAAIAANAIGASEMADGAIDAATFAAGAINAAAVATDAIDADALAADAVTEIWAKAIAELAQAAPSATPSVLNAIAALYMALRNVVTVTSTTKSFTNDAGTVVFKKALTDDGTTYTEAEAVAGP